MSQYILATELLKLSSSQIWDEAKLEWELVDTEKVENPQTCLCGHYPIVNICTIKNNKTNKIEIVGNCCVKKFDDRFKKILDALTRVKKDLYKSLNSETIQFAFDKKYINEWERKFSIDTIKKQNTIANTNIIEKRKQINEKIISKIIK